MMSRTAASAMSASTLAAGNGALAAAEAPDLRDAYEQCRRITRANARNFYFGLRLTPEPKRSSLYAIYSWMRLADDLVDDSAGDEAALGDFRERTGRVFRGAWRPHRDAGHAAEIDGHRDMWLAFADTVQRFRLRETEFREMIEGQLSDLHGARYQTVDDLINYCRHVASTVGLVCIAIWGYDGSERARRLAEWRGIAFQLTNILRDYAEDYDAGRVYLPADDFARFGLTPSELRHWSRPEACLEFMRFQIKRAGEYYDRSAPLDALVHEDGRAALAAMTRIYRRLLDLIAVAPKRAAAGTARIRVATSRKIMIGLRAAWTRRRNGS